MTRRLNVAKDAAEGSAWMSIRMIALAVWLWLLTRLIQTDEFGWLATLFASNAICTLLCQAGIPYLFFPDQHKEGNDRPHRWQETLGTILIVTPVIALPALWLLPQAPNGLQPFPFIYGFMVADIGLNGFVQTLALKGHATGRIRLAVALPAILALGRICAAVIATLNFQFPSGDILQSYLILHTAFTLAAAALSYVWVNARIPLPLKPLLPSKSSLGQAWKYSAMGGSSLLAGEIDKPIAAHSLGLAITGHYAITYRICGMLATPFTALSAAQIPRWLAMLSEGQMGLMHRSFLHTFFIVALSGTLLTLLVNLLSPIVATQIPTLLYPETWRWLYYLTWLIPLLGLHQTTSAALLALGMPTQRTIIDVASFFIFCAIFYLLLADLQEKSLPIACLTAELFAVSTGVIILATAVKAAKAGSKDDAR